MPIWHHRTVPVRASYKSVGPSGFFQTSDSTPAVYADRPGNRGVSRLTQIHPLTSLLPDTQAALVSFCPLNVPASRECREPWP